MYDNKTTALLIATAALLGACGGGSAFEGVYEATAWTENTAGCDAEGPSKLADEFQTTFYIKLEDFFGKFLNVKFCDDVAMCKEEAGDDGTIHIGSFTFESGGDDGWSADYYSGFGDFDTGICDGDYVEASIAPSGEDGVRIEVRRTEAGGFMEESDGFCDDDKGNDAAAGQPCTELEVLTAARVDDL